MKTRMTHVYPPPARYRFRAGPYTPLVVGTTTKDEWYGSVTVAGMTTAPIPWPAFEYRAHFMPILAGGLVRAVLEETEGAVAHFWGVSRYTVLLWRKALAGTAGADVHARLALLRRDPKFRKRFGYKD
jgi:hypothetical protein